MATKTSYSGCLLYVLLHKSKCKPQKKNSIMGYVVAIGLLEQVV